MNHKPEAAVNYLRRDALRHVLHLKMLAHHGDRVETKYLTRDSAEGVLLLFPTSTLSYDHQQYGEYDLVAMPAADSPLLLDRLLEGIPRSGVVIKLVGEADEALVKSRFSGRRARAFLNFTAPATTRFRPDPAVVIAQQLNDQLIAAFAHNGHSPADLARFFSSGAQALSIMEAGVPVSVGMVYQDYESIWEVAALYTQASARRQGYASRIVRTAIHILQRPAYTPRYVVDESNTPSVRLAQTAGLQQFLKVVHFAVD